MTVAAGCAGCGGPLPPARGTKPRKWCSERCRKASYGDRCVDCGARTSFGAERARIPEPRCPRCSDIAGTWWTRDRVLARVREWAEAFGEPPAMADWDLWFAEHALHDRARADRFRMADGYWPTTVTVIRMFGSWNAGIRAAGFSPRFRYGSRENAARRRERNGAAR